MRRPVVKALIFAGLDRVERTIGTSIADDAWAPVCESGKGKRLAHVEDVLAVHLILQERVTRGVSGRSVRGRQRLLQRSKKRKRKAPISHGARRM